MNADVPVKKLLRIALFTSTAIGLITMGPAYIIGITLANMNTSPAVLLKLVLMSVTGITVFHFPVLAHQHHASEIFYKQNFWFYEEESEVPL